MKMKPTKGWREREKKKVRKAKEEWRTTSTGCGVISFNPFAPGDFAKKLVLKLVEWFSGHCRAIKS